MQGAEEMRGTTGTTGTRKARETRDARDTRETHASPVAEGATGTGIPAAHAAHAAPAAPVPQGTPEAPGAPAPPAHGTTEPPTAAPLIAHEESDQLSRRMQHAVSGFIDGPRSAVEEADHALEEIAARFADAVTQRRRTLRRSWQDADEDRATSADTEQLRLTLRDYRELADRLLRQ
ncbi:hypothetical protein [Streptomyces sp. NPDC006997]|uniref:hypothetical protein n=1 Tax=Streptomyces sp. NPDC006997 TaxID=3155356 RepID=UPI0033FCF0F2